MVNFLLSKEFLERPNKIDVNRQYTTIKKVRKKQKNEKKFNKLLIIKGFLQSIKKIKKIINF